MRERALELAELANRLASAMHARTSNGDDLSAFGPRGPIIRDLHVISLTGQKFDRWRTGWSIFVRIPDGKDHVNLFVRGNAKAYEEGGYAPAFQQDVELTGAWLGKTTIFVHAGSLAQRLSP